jgi:hypothetical protein
VRDALDRATVRSLVPFSVTWFLRTTPIQKPGWLTSFYAAGAPLSILCTSMSHLPLDISSSISERSSSLLC